jgi:hypothetical protein
MKAPHLLLLCSLGLGSLVDGATVSLITEGTINQSSSGTYPFVEAGDAFRLTVSFSDHFADTNADPDLGVYLPNDLSMILEIIGKGVAFESIGGSVNVLTRPADFPVYSIISRAQPNGHSLFLVFTDLDRSHAPIFGDAIPIDFGQFGDYDSVGFSIVVFPDPYDLTLPIPGSPPPTNPMDGLVTSFVVPESSIAMFSGLALALGVIRRRRIHKVEQEAPSNGGQRSSLNSGLPSPPWMS